MNALPLPVGAEDDNDSSELEEDDNDDEGEVIGTGENSDMLISDSDDQSLWRRPDSPLVIQLFDYHTNQHSSTIFISYFYYFH